MSETKHTPWSFEVKGSRVVILLGPDEPSTEEVSLRLYGGEDADRDAETIAKARLMASSPDLLSACREALALISEFEVEALDGRDDVPDLLRAAIAKATGR